MSAQISALYSGARRCLWVEDEETRTYLTAVWGGSQHVRLLVAGGGDSVPAAANHAWRDGHAHVFGLVDRDFGRSNRHRWATPDAGLRVYRTEAHEVENWLLDAKSLAACRLNRKLQHRTAPELESRIATIARGMAWWLAFRRVLSDLSAEATVGFPPVPGRSQITTCQDGLDYMIASDWFTVTIRRALPAISRQQVSTRLVATEADYAAALGDDRWRSEVSGKEVFREIAGFVHVQGRGAAARLDLVKSVAEQQRIDGRVPAEVAELLSSLQSR